MRLCLTTLTAAVAGWSWLSSSAVAADQPSAADLLEYRVAAPPAVGVRKLGVGFEMNAPTAAPSVLKTKDGRFMMIGGGSARYSSDGGRTWTKPEKLSVGVGFVIRLNDGKLGGATGGVFYTSADEGKTWEKRGKIYTSNMPGSPYGTGSASIFTQTRSGRLVHVLRFTSGAGHDGLYDRTMSWGTLNGQLTAVEGHAHWPEPDIGFAYYSDDEGKTWKKSEGGIMVWHQDGHGGMWPCDEPSIVTAGKDDGKSWQHSAVSIRWCCRLSAGWRRTPSRRWRAALITSVSCPPTTVACRIRLLPSPTIPSSYAGAGLWSSRGGAT